jgi:hypothetical protein
MTAERHDDQRTSRSLTRRQLTFCLAGIAGICGIGRLGGSVLASGQLPGANLTELATYGGWRRSWDLIVPLSSDRAFPRPFLLYDRSAGEAKLIVVDANGDFREVRQFSGWRRSWDTITPSGFPRTLGVYGLILYDKAAGALGTLQIDQFGGLRELQTYSTWRKSWTAFVPVGTAGFVAYDRAAGFGALFSVEATGTVREVRSYNTWRQTWDLITAGPFTTGAMPPGDLLFYDRSARQAEGMTFLGTGQTIPFASYSGWRSTWTAIHGGSFRFQGFSGSGAADLMLFDQAAQELEFLDIGSDSLLTSLLLTGTPGARDWTTVAAIGPDLLLLYDRAAGTSGFYATDRTPHPTPTPTLIPPTPTPTPVVPQTDRVTIRLQQGRGNLWHTYTAKADNPKTGSGLNAYITGVKNDGEKRIALIHRDKSGKRTGPVFVKAGELSDGFNGMAVGGDWEARITGSQSEAPARIPLEVRYEIR